MKFWNLILEMLFFKFSLLINCYFVDFGECDLLSCSALAGFIF